MFKAWALPLFCLCLMTSAPALAASRAVLSLDPSSITMMCCAYFSVLNTTLAMNRSSLKAGMTAIILCASTV